MKNKRQVHENRSKPARNHRHLRKAGMCRTVRLFYILITGVQILVIGCSRSEQSEGTNARPSPVISPIEVQTTPSTFVYEVDTFSSQIEFVERGSRCGTAPPSDFDRRIVNEVFETARSESRSPGSVPINVHFHVITKGPKVEDGNVPDTWIAAQLATLNEGFSGQRPGGAGTNTPFRFILASKDVTANATWFYARKDSAEERAMKKALRRGTAKDLNLYTNEGAGLLGWATFPWNYAGDVESDGVVCKFTSLPGSSSTPFNLGDTAVHEVGHWLGLFHTFQGGCSDPNDNVGDTSAHAMGTAGCPAVVPDTCTGPQFPGSDPVDNFMNYSDDGCMFKFTAEQVIRMDTLQRQYRGV